MKIKLTHKEANLLIAILWELAEEGGRVLPNFDPMWRLTDVGSDIAKAVIEKLEDANAKTGKDRDLSGSPKGSIQEARWEK